ncbi:GTP cyclohydrolase 1 [Fulvitalea axinellae]|uniref:GTP cyclohydrolase 1 n=1 Tax=Fulvitalea axinellae TaxID=1182444 RepID=A0AAU9CVB0_9BACT|nr:GTP cyclohydrolase 1 [Fulvitalea axinellae]
MDDVQKELIGDNHVLVNKDTPLRADAFDKPDEVKVKNIQRHFERIMEELGLDLTDDSLSGTPYRVAKMYVKELFYGLRPDRRPKVSAFENKYAYDKILVEQDIVVDSVCEHHFLPIVGYAHIGYIPSGKVVGLSKINRLVDYYSHRPQVQERLCLQVLEDLQESLETESVIVIVSAKHLCVSSRGIKDKSSFTTTMEYGGVFNDSTKRDQFLKLLEAGRAQSFSV